MTNLHTKTFSLRKGLRTHQRNLYCYFIKNGIGCKIPLHASFGVKKKEHICALDALEELKLIKINRIHSDYRLWTLAQLIIIDQAS